ncbi:MAG: Gfo/Idh/MocA family oxidoreductase, partial [Prolixibacteraceae bacterium]|nr:Gfo/Idh/MocA family oxidoreductase [Prolixibacteraceae bacterium]
YNWAVLGCGKIARKFSSDLKLLPNAKLYAAASRSLEKAQAFAHEFGFEKAFGSYEALVTDPSVDAVYIATPHSHHRDHAILCLKNKKAVLNEKAFALNLKEAREIVDTARENDTFLMEAFWTQFQPSFLKAMEILNSRELGELKMVRSDFAFNGPYDPKNRLYNLELGGGSLLDIGIYPVFAALRTLGKPDRIKAMADFSPTGSEESISMIFKYNSGQMASLASSFAAFSSVQTEFWCEKGYIRLNREWHTPTSVSILRKAINKEEIIDFSDDPGFGYQYEASHVMECLDKNLKESPVLPLSFSLGLMETLDRIRDEVGAFYPGRD